MSIYINKDELLKEFDIAKSAMELHGQEFSSSFLNAGQEISTEWFCVESIVDFVPTIEIIHCKDCEWYCGHERYCSNDIFARENGYCYHGKKRTTENDDV